MGLVVSEKKIIEGCINGVRASQKEFYELYCKKIGGICSRYLKDADEAQDATQEAFIKAFGNIKNFKGECPVEMWLRRIAINECLNRIRSRRHTVTEEVLDYSGDFYCENDALSKIAQKDIIKAIHSLPEGYRAVFNLKVVDGYQHSEIARMLGIAEGTSKSQYSRAKASLQRMLVGQLMESPKVA
jgi:RNA polymerase sigma factor (sigma-70 family)